MTGLHSALPIREGTGEGGRDPRRQPGAPRLPVNLPRLPADAVDELSGAIAAAGYRVLEPPHRVGRLGPYQSVVLDPDGNQVKLTV